MGKDINSFHLLDYNICFDEDQVESRKIDNELAVEILEEDIVASEALNRKTFLYKALLAAVRSRKLVALATASSGVAASILPGGRTTHSHVKIPLDTDEHSMCYVSKQSVIAKLLRMARLIIWNEAPMSRKQHIEVLDKMLRDINDSELTFSEKVVVFGGDFRQVLPVVHKGTRQEHVDASLVSSYLWPTLIKFHLTENMRARLDPVFSEYVLELGNKMPPITVDETIKISDGMLVPYEDDSLKMQTVYTSIKDITPSTRDWKIKMIVAEKSPKRTGQRSPVKYQSLTLIDPEENQLQATIFDKDIDSRQDTLHIFQSYYINNAYVKPLDPKYRIETHEYQ
ncbi:uncharacterized protein LOC122298841 [Carya illinoinensis]|uniref:uncharacterized protein LOC122298841 n=1 Tax=Carya illinoinensis TaxID=32201 RepID=UPI001C720832|nr:uncharacterized protein LOC122298841 [Carya illinoinensis]